MVSDMKNLIIISLAFLFLACSSSAAPLQLGGSAGKAILGTIDLNNSTNVTNSTNESELWNWGKMPIGHSINASSGKLKADQTNDDGFVVVPPRSDS